MAIADRINEMYTHVGDVYDTITNVDLPTNKNIQNIPSTMRSSYLEIMNNGIDKIWNNWEKVTGSGTDISLSPTLEAPMKNVLNGNTYQFTTTGKNKLDTTNISTISTQTGITITPTYEEGLLKNLVVSGTPTTTSWNTIKSIFLKAGSYILTGLNISDRTKTGLRIGVYIDRDRQYFISANSTSYSFTLSEDTGMNFVVWVQSVNDYPTGTNIITPMIRLSSVSDDTYEPYTGGQASPNPDFPSDIHVVSGNNAIQIQSPNYFDYEDTNSVSSQITTDSEGWISCTYDNSASTSVAYFNYWTKPINVKPSTNYLLVLEVKSVSGSGRIVPSSSLGTGITQFETTSKWFSEIESNKVYTFPITSNDDLSSAVYSLRSFVQFNGGQSGSITFRLSVLNDTTITANTFKYYSYSLDSYPINLPIENLFDKSASSVDLGSNIMELDTGIRAISRSTDQWVSRVYVLNIDLRNKEGQSYTLYANANASASNIPYFGIGRCNSSGSSRTAFQTRNTSGSITATIPSIANGDDKYYLYVVFASNSTGTTAIGDYVDYTNIMLEQGSKVNSYTPYGTTPIELCNINTYKDNILRTSGKNLFDKSTIQSGDIRNASPTIRLCSRQNLWLEPGTYTFSTNLSSPFRFGIGVQNVGAPPLDNYPTYIYESFWQTTSPITFTIDSGGYCNINISKTDNGTLSVNDIIDFNYQLEKGSTATDYEPYGSGEWYTHKELGKVVLNGSESWFAEAQRYRLDNIIQGKTFSTFDENNPLAYCNSFKWGNGVSNNYVYGAFWYTANGLNLSMQKDENPNATTLANFKTWLESNNQKVYYVLATSTYTKITYEPLLEQLEAFYNAKSKNSQTNITQENNDLPFIIDSTMLKEV